MSKQALLRSVALFIPLLAAPGPALAQEPAGPVLEEIVVTAQKRAENLQDVPITVTAASGEALTASGVTSTQQLGTLAPGLTIRTTTGSFMPAIRGIGTGSSVVENPVSLYIDGVYLPQQREGLRELRDIAQVAVLKGPQGTLFGRNATGGVIQITTRAPSHEFSGEAGLQIDNYETVKADLYLTGGLTDTLAASLSASYATQGEGWGRSLTTGRDTFKVKHDASIRAKFLFEPSDRTSLAFIADYGDREALSNSQQPYPGTSYSFIGLPPLGDVHDTYAGTDSFNNFKGGGVSLTVEHDLGFADLVSITSYRKGKAEFQFDNAGDPGSSFLVLSPDAPNEDYTQELQLISPEGRLSWVVGAFYFNNLNAVEPIQRRIRGPLAPLPTSTTLNTTFGREETESFAPFGQADFDLTPATTITVGARYTYEKRDYDGTTRLDLINGTATVSGQKATLKIEKPTYRLALSHQFTDDILGYVSLNTGIKSGGFNIVNPANRSYLPEKLTAYEVGLKNELFDRRLRLNLAAFYYDYTNVQVIQFLGGFQTIVNGASAELYGLDLDFQAEVAEGLRLSGGFELAHSEFVDFPNAVFSTPRPTGGAALFAANAAGRRLPLAQEFTATLAVDYHRETSHGAWDFNVTGNHNGDYYFEPDNRLQQDAYLMLNASVRWTPTSERYSLTLWGKNLTDAEVITQPTTQSFGYPTTYGAAPLTWGVTARADF